MMLHLVSDIGLVYMDARVAHTDHTPHIPTQLSSVSLTPVIHRSRSGTATSSAVIVAPALTRAVTPLSRHQMHQSTGSGPIGQPINQYERLGPVARAELESLSCPSLPTYSYDTYFAAPSTMQPSSTSATALLGSQSNSFREASVSYSRSNHESLPMSDSFNSMPTPIYQATPFRDAFAMQPNDFDSALPPGSHHLGRGIDPSVASAAFRLPESLDTPHEHIKHSRLVVPSSIPLYKSRSFTDGPLSVSVPPHPEAADQGLPSSQAAKSPLIAYPGLWSKLEMARKRLGLDKSPSSSVPTSPQPLDMNVDAGAVVPSQLELPAQATFPAPNAVEVAQEGRSTSTAPKPVDLVNLPATPKVYRTSSLDPATLPRPVNVPDLSTPLTRQKTLPRLVSKAEQRSTLPTTMANHVASDNVMTPAPLKRLAQQMHAVAVSTQPTVQGPATQTNQIPAAAVAAPVSSNIPVPSITNKLPLPAEKMSSAQEKAADVAELEDPPFMRAVEATFKRTGVESKVSTLSTVSSTSSVVVARVAVNSQQLRAIQELRNKARLDSQASSRAVSRIPSPKQIVQPSLPQSPLAKPAVPVENVVAVTNPSMHSAAISQVEHHASLVVQSQTYHSNASQNSNQNAQPAPAAAHPESTSSVQIVPSNPQTPKHRHSITTRAAETKVGATSGQNIEQPSPQKPVSTPARPIAPVVIVQQTPVFTPLKPTVSHVAPSVANSAMAIIRVQRSPAVSAAQSRRPSVHHLAPPSAQLAPQMQMISASPVHIQTVHLEPKSATVDVVSLPFPQVASVVHAESIDRRPVLAGELVNPVVKSYSVPDAATNQIVGATPQPKSLRTPSLHRRETSAIRGSLDSASIPDVMAPLRRKQQQIAVRQFVSVVSRFQKRVKYHAFRFLMAKFKVFKQCQSIFRHLSARHRTKNLRVAFRNWMDWVTLSAWHDAVRPLLQQRSEAWNRLKQFEVRERNDRAWSRQEDMQRIREFEARRQIDCDVRALWSQFYVVD